MNCEESRNLMLMRPEELTKKEAEGLRLHVRTCKACTVLLKQAREDLRRLEAIRAFQPEIPDPERLTEAILNGAWKPDRRISAEVAGKFAGMFAVSRIRIVYASFVVAAVAVFLGQLLWAATAVDSLEHRMSLAAEQPPVAVEYSVPARLVPPSKNLQALMNRSEVRREDGLLVVSREGISRVLELMGNLVLQSDSDLKREGMKGLQSLAKTLERSASARVTILSKEPS